MADFWAAKEATRPGTALGAKPVWKASEPGRRIRFRGEEPPPQPPKKTAPEADTSADFFKKIQLMDQLKPPFRKQVYQDLRLKHSGFWRDQMENMAHGLVGLANVGMRTPLYLLRGSTRIMNAVVPPSKRLLSRDDVQRWIDRSIQRAEARTETFVAPVQRWVEPATLEASIDRDPYLGKLSEALEVFGEKGVVSFQRFEALFERLKDPKGEGFATPRERALAETLVVTFPLMATLSDTPDTLTPATVERFRQNVKNSIPFLYAQYGQTPSHYVNANLFHLGVLSTLPDTGSLKRAGEQVSKTLNASPTYRKVARWAKDYQLGDTQFLPIYSFVDALYAQITAYGTGLVDQFSMNRVFSQMVALDGVFNGIGFFLTKFQILLVGWEKEKPDRLRAKYEKTIRIFSKKKEDLQNRLEAARAKLAEDLKANPDQAEALQKQFEKEVLQPITRETNKLLKGVDTFQLRLDKLLGVKEMGVLERAWKKPPKLLNDLKYMLPISMGLTLPYEYFYFNKYTDFGMDFFSFKFMLFCSYMTTLSAIGNVIIKSIIHITQDNAKLYLHGKKDELLALNTRETLANLQGAAQNLLKSDNPKLKALGDKLEAFYQTVAVPLIGDPSMQSGTEKAQNREAKLSYSMAKTETLQILLKDMEQEMVKTNKLPRKAPERRSMKILHKYMKMLHTLHDRLAYAPIHRTQFDLTVMSDFYRREIEEPGLEVYLPAQYTQAFKQTVQESQETLKGLERQYPRAELPFEPLLLKAGPDGETMRALFENAQAQMTVDASVGRRSWFRFWGRSKANPGQELPADSIGSAVTRFAQEATTPEEKEALAKVLKTFQKTRKGFTKDLYYLEARSKETAESDMAEYKALREAYAEETAEMSFLDYQKYKRMMVQAGMATHSAYQSGEYLSRYNKWLSGFHWVPAHSLLNVAGRLGLTSIVQGQLLPASIMFQVWAFGHIPIRFWTFFNEKFMVMRDEHHRNHGDVENRMKDGMEAYIQKLLEEQGMGQAFVLPKEEAPPPSVSELPKKPPPPPEAPQDVA